MASFFNTKPEDAITAIGAAFRGETEPIRRYGVMLDDATMRQKAFELGLVASTKKALLPQTKVLAAQALILEKTKVAQGDFARTSSGLENQKRILNARIKNTSATLGKIYLPIALEVAKVFNIMLSIIKPLAISFNNLNEKMKNNVAGWVAIVAAIGPAVFLFGKVSKGLTFIVPLLVAARNGTLTWAGAMAILNKSLMVKAALITALVGVGWYFYNNWETIKNQLVVVWGKIKLGVIKMNTSIIDSIIDVVEVMSSFAKGLDSFFPGLKKGLDNTLIGLNDLSAALYGMQIAQLKAVDSASKEIGAQKTLKETLQETKKSLKDLIDVKDEGIVKTQKQIETEKQAAEAEKQRAKDRVAFEKLISDEIDDTILTEREKLEKQKNERLARAKELGANEFLIKQAFALKETELNEQQLVTRDRIKKHFEEKEKARLEKRNKTYLKAGRSLYRSLEHFESNRLKKIQFNANKEIQAIRRSTMSQEEKERRIQKIEEETEKKRIQIERRQMIREKAINFFSSVVNTFRAVAEALPNIPLSIAVGAAGAAQSAAIISEPMPFFDGGLIKGSPKGVNAIAGENNQDELVFPLETGLNSLVDGFIERVANFEPPTFEPQESGNTIELNIGTFIGDERGLKELERRLYDVRISENQRKGF